jgi:AraC-like DNA-binding protein
MGHDALSDVLKAVRLTGAIFFNVAAHAPWVAEQPSKQAILDRILPGAGHLIAFHLVTEGRCFANIVGQPPVMLEAGEVVVFTQGDPHVIGSGPGMRADADRRRATAAATAGELPCFVSYGSAGNAAQPVKIVCGFLACDDRPFNPLIENLPATIKAGRPGPTDWLARFLTFALDESADARPGRDSILAKLSELVFIEVVREYIETLPLDHSGWLAGLRDPVAGKALAMLHAEPARDWSLDELARAIGVSRSVLAERFTALVGMAPMHYLAKWRMQLAATLLSSGKANIASVASEVGYASEASFSRAFKKVVGFPPSAWRHRDAAASSSAADAA